MTRYCVNGHEVDDRMNFCPQCGAKILDNGKKQVFCKKCGHERVGTEKFCSQCGTPYIGKRSSAISAKISKGLVKRHLSSLLIGFFIASFIGGYLYYWNHIRYSLWGLSKTLIENEFSEVGAFSDGLAMISNDDYKIGYIDNKGNIIAPCIYDRFEDGSYNEASEGLICVQKDEKFGFIDKNGKEVIPCKYDSATSFSEGLAAVEKDGKWGFVDKTGKEVIPCKYDSATSFSEGLAAVEKDGKQCFIDKNGNEVFSCKYYSAEAFSEGLALVWKDAQDWKDRKKGFIDKTGKEFVPCKYDDAHAFSEGFAKVEKDGKHGFIDKNGKEVVPCKYDWAYDFSDELAAVEKDGKWGFVDKTGKEVIPCKYNWCDNFSEGLAAFSDNDYMLYGFIDKTGKEVIPCIYDREEDYNPGFSNGLAKVVKDGLCGFIDKSGKVIIPFGKFDGVDYFSEGLAWVYKDGMRGVVNTKGKSTFDYLSESQLIAMRKNHKRAEKEKIAKEEEERRKWEEENTPSKVFYNAAKRDIYVWMNDYSRANRVIFFYPSSEKTGTVSYVVFENVPNSRYSDYRYYRAYDGSSGKGTYIITDNYITCTINTQSHDNAFLPGGLINPNPSIRHITLEIKKEGDGVTLYRIDPSQQIPFKQIYKPTTDPYNKR